MGKRTGTGGEITLETDIQMQQKQTYQHYLLIGISLLLSFSACEEQVDYRVRADWIYVNETPNSVEILGVDRLDRQSFTTIAPGDSVTASQDTEGPETVTEKSYVPSFLGYTIRYADSLCRSYRPGATVEEGEGPFATVNYESEKLAERYYKFTYEFTEEEFAEAESCQ